MNITSLAEKEHISTEEFISKYSTLVTPNICMHYNIDYNNIEERSILAYKIVTDRRELEDLTNLNFSYSIKSSGTQGSFLKALDNDTYYKMSYVSGDEVVGHESVNEVIANRLCELFGFDYLPYDLHYAKTKTEMCEYTSWLVSSKNYKEENEQRITLEMYLQTNDCNTTNYDETFKFILQLPEDIVQSLFNLCVIDFIIYNRDRHGANIELLVNNDSMRLAPIFDCGCSLVSPYHDDIEEIEKFNPLTNKRVNNFIGSSFLVEMISKWPSSFHVDWHKWKSSYLDDLPKDALNDVVWPKINECIEKRMEWLYEIRRSVT